MVAVPMCPLVASVTSPAGGAWRPAGEPLRVSRSAGSTQDAIIFADRNSIVRLWNAGAETIFGYPVAEAIGHSLNRLIPERLRARHWEGYRQVIATGSTHYDRKLLAVPALRKDGTQSSLEFTVVIVHELQGEVHGMAAVLRDVTERWQRERAMRARLAAFDSTQQA